MIVQECDYVSPHAHEFPADWRFGGADDQDPRSDPRWRGTTYIYLDASLHVVWTTQAPLCDEQAVAEFSKHADIGAKYLQAKRPGAETELWWEYDAGTDTASKLG